MVIFFTLSYFFDTKNYTMPMFERFKTSQMLNIDNLKEPDPEKEDYGRTIIISEGIRAIHERPLLGIGYGGLKGYIENHYGRGRISHNIIITMWGEMGLPGLLSLLWIIWVIYIGIYRFRISKTTTQKEKILASATCVALLLAFINAQFRPFFFNPMIPIILGQTWSFIRLTQTRDRPVPSCLTKGAM